ncbi:Putative Ca2+/H+ antiporter, TMEM165/GDT1 family [Natronincola peptidivorans]|uniref:GDT1 family protein n=1 Tax=Natronincola peptidivorans TaxID=426128 RepID=A0A1I0GHH7_9FIRM|nr:TMEM165/GDT1 family protein [Natronincola peptidivorans]SET70332.1 Putative Ca2+/H+ antiporter, TMEM165/GDT1 family [Natronincola peptidivorans]
MYELVQSFFIIIMAEMGDKTQILAMAFAVKYSLSKVLLGVFLGSALNHGLAALLGVYLTQLIPIDIIRLIAALAFIGFGLWTLQIDASEEEEQTSNRFGAVLTVASAFALGEFGDKTQLAVITLSTQAHYPFLVLIGSVSGMVVTSGLGVFVGSRLGKKVPEITLKLVSSVIFITFGLLALRDTVPPQYMTLPITSGFMVILVCMILTMINRIRTQASEDTPFKKAAGELYLNTEKLQASLSRICQENHQCAVCDTGKCTIIFLQNRLYEAQEKEQFLVDKEWEPPLCTKKGYPLYGLKESLIETINICLECPNHRNNCVGNQTRKTLEILYFGKHIPFNGSKEEYYGEIVSVEPHFFH